MRRRDFLGGLGGAVLLPWQALPLLAAPQKEGKPGILSGAHAVGNRKVLFFDDRYLQSITRLTRTMHPARKHAGNPVITADKIWEGDATNSLLFYLTVLYDPEERIFKMWYNALGDQSAAHFVVCYATSRDGITWEKPALDVVPLNQVREHLTLRAVPFWFKGVMTPEEISSINQKMSAGLTGNNIVSLGSGLPDYRQALLGGVVYCPWEADSSRRYKMLFWDTSHKLNFGTKEGLNYAAQTGFCGGFAAFSPDGIHWTNHAGIVLNVSDIVNTAWDAQKKRYVTHFKMWQILPRPEPGKRVVQSAPLEFAATFDTLNVSPGVWEVRGPFWGAAGGEPQVGTLTTIRIENCAGVDMRRVIGRAESKDFIHWTDYAICLIPDDQDQEPMHTYGMPVFCYEGMYIGFPRFYVASGAKPVDTQLAFSYDDVRWHRAHDRSPFIARTPGAWDGGWLGAANEPVRVGDELWIYYCAMRHGEVEPNTAGIGLARLRVDGFVSLGAGEEPGEAVTVPFEFQGERLEINAVATKGEVSVEVRDQQGRSRRGFAFADCKSFRGDSVAHQVRWGDKSSLRRLKGQTVQLAFRLHQAQLYAFQVM